MIPDSSVVEYWNGMYCNLTAPVTFSDGEPSAEVVEAAAALPVGVCTIDLGCGDGRNALFLASQGFLVRATDISPVGIAKLRQFAAERDLVVDAFVQDMRQATFETDYHLVVSMGCLHLVERECWVRLLRRMQEGTRLGGYHAVGVMTDALPPPDDQREFFIGLFGEGELFEQYADWEIITQRSVQFHDEHPGGVRHHHAGDTILARKV
jgi:tellurite methyltransferase